MRGTHLNVENIIYELHDVQNQVNDACVMFMGDFCSISAPPSFSTSEPEDQLTNFTVNQGDGVVIPCSVEGDPRPQIRWFKDESPISNTDLHYFIRQDSSLEIFSSDSEDTGSYKCQASNIAGSIDKTVSLFVRGM